MTDTSIGRKLKKRKRHRAECATKEISHGNPQASADNQYTIGLFPFNLMATLDGGRDDASKFALAYVGEAASHVDDALALLAELTEAFGSMFDDMDEITEELHQRLQAARAACVAAMTASAHLTEPADVTASAH